MQGKAIPSFVRQKIIESWLEWKGNRTGTETSKQTMLNDVNNDMECCKTTYPSIYSSEIQNKLVKNYVPAFARKCPVACIDQPQRNTRSWGAFD